MDCKSSQKYINAGDIHKASAHLAQCEICRCYAESFRDLDILMSESASLYVDNVDRMQLWSRIEATTRKSTLLSRFFDQYRWLTAPALTIAAAIVIAGFMPLAGSSRESRFSAATSGDMATATYVAGHQLAKSSYSIISQPYTISAASSSTTRTQNASREKHADH